MSVEAPFSARRYYDTAPDAHVHRTGDIWTGIPTLGLLPPTTCSGLVITPACDLSNGKADAVTILPIITISSYVGLPIFYTYVRGAIVGLMREIIGSEAAALMPKGHIPDAPSVKLLRDKFDNACNGRNGNMPSEKQRVHLPRINAAIEWLLYASATHGNALTQPSANDIFPPTEWERIRKDIVRNAFRPDIHFLPAEREPTPWPAIGGHAVTMFRYPIAVPLHILDLANVTPEASWSDAIHTAFGANHYASHFKAARPLKALRLQAEFLHDLLTRFVSLHVRVGSPDFTNEAVDLLAAEIR